MTRTYGLLNYEKIYTIISRNYFYLIHNHNDTSFTKDVKVWLYVK